MVRATSRVLEVPSVCLRRQSRTVRGEEWSVRRPEAVHQRHRIAVPTQTSNDTVARGTIALPGCSSGGEHSEAVSSDSARGPISLVERTLGLHERGIVHREEVAVGHVLECKKW